MKPLVFDFDGVIMDSVEEVLYAAYSAAYKRIPELNGLPDGYREMYRLNRFHAQQAGDVFSLGAWCAEHPKPLRLLTAEQYQEILGTFKSPIAHRSAQFFHWRNKLKESYSERWFLLNQPFKHLWQALVAHPEKLRIVTNKNRQAVLELCSYFGMPLAHEQVYSGDDGVTKHENFNKLLASEFPDGCAFIDDSIKNLCDLQSDFSRDQLELILASWGYCGPEDPTTAKKHNITIWDEKTCAAAAAKQFSMQALSR